MLLGGPKSGSLRREGLLLGGLAVASGAITAGWGGWYGIEGPFGSDAPWWLLSAADLGRGVGIQLPPLYPWLVHLAHRGTGGSLVGAGLGVAAMLAALLPPVTYLSARSLGAGRRWGLLAALLVLAWPVRATWTVQAQPESLTALVLLGLTPLLVRAMRRPSLATVLPACALGAVAPVAREHGSLLIPLLLVVLVGLRWPVGRRVVAVAGLLAGVLLVPALMGQGAGVLDWESNWWHRVARPLVDMYGDRVPEYATDPSINLLGEEKRRYQEWVLAGDRLALHGFHLRHALRNAPTGWLWLALGLGSAALLPRGVRGPAILPLAPSLGALVVFSQPRHVEVAVPAAMAVSVAAAALGRGWSRPVVLAGAGLLALWAGPRWLAEGREHGRLSRPHRQAREVAAILCPRMAPDDVVAWRVQYLMEPTLYCPRPRHQPTGEGTAADWHAWYFAEHPPAGVAPVPEIPPQWGVYRLRPDLEGPARPCAGSRLVGVESYTRPGHAIEMDPPCRQDPGALAPVARPLER